MIFMALCSRRHSSDALLPIGKNIDIFHFVEHWNFSDGATDAGKA
jgi:hypothetical protein